MSQLREALDLARAEVVRLMGTFQQLQRQEVSLQKVPPPGRLIAWSPLPSPPPSPAPAQPCPRRRRSRRSPPWPVYRQRVLPRVVLPLSASARIAAIARVRAWCCHCCRCRLTRVEPMSPAQALAEKSDSNGELRSTLEQSRSVLTSLQVRSSVEF